MARRPAPCPASWCAAAPEPRVHRGVLRLDCPLKLLLLALGAMFAQQTFASIGRGLPSVVAPAVIGDLAFDPAWYGTYVSLAALASLGFQLGCGSFILRYGALRLSQV